MEPSHHLQSLEVEGVESQCQRLPSQGQHPCQQLLGACLMEVFVCVCVCGGGGGGGGGVVTQM